MRDERVDAELLSSGVASDFGCLYDRHVRAVTAFVGSWIGEPDVLFDLVAETFARALEHRLQYDPSRGPTVAWLLGIARNLMIDSNPSRRHLTHTWSMMGSLPGAGANS